MIRKAKEGDITWFPGLTTADIPYPLPNGINVHVKRDLLGLEIQGLIGAIPLRNGDTLQIRPKIGHINFLRLLFRAEGCQRDLEKAYDEFVEYSIDDEENFDAIVARQLFYCAYEILKRSPQITRISRWHMGPFAVGRIDAVATAFNVSCCKEAPVVYISKDKTEDIPENRVITEAVIRSWSMLNEITRQEVGVVYDKWLRRFPKSHNPNADLEQVERGFSASKYGGPRDYYRKALMLSQIILGSNGIGFSEAATILGDAVLLNSADVFEKYVREVIRGAYSSAGYIVTKGGIEGASLYTDGSFKLLPDIVISRNNRTMLIVDAKYKVPDSGDHYQMAAYLNTIGVNRGLLISPLFDEGEVIVKEFVTSNRVVIREAYLPLNNLELTEEFLETVIERFVS